MLHRRSDLHLLRKSFHIGGGIIILIPLWYLRQPTEWMAAMMSMVLAGVLSVEYSRKTWPKANELALKVFGPVMRDSEADHVSGIPFYAASCLFAILIFPYNIKVIAIMHLVFGDPSSSFFGVLFGKDKLFPHKSLQGTLGGFLVCTIVTAFFLYQMEIATKTVLLMSMIGGLSGAIAELLPLKVDDNLSIPLVSGAFMLLAFWCAGLPMS